MASTNNPIRDKGFLLTAFVFSFFFIVNLITTGAHTDIADGAVTFLITESMATKHSAKLHPDTITTLQSRPEDSLHRLILHDIHFFKSGTGEFAEWVRDSKPLEPVYSPRSLLLPAISVPFYDAAIAFSVSPVVLVSFFVNSLIIALCSLVIFCFSSEIYRSTRIAFVLALVFTVCSFVLPYNTTLYPQPLQALLLFTAAYFAYKSSRSIIISKNASLTLSSNFSDPANMGIVRQQNITHNDKNRAIIFAQLAALFLGLSVFAQPASLLFVPAFVGYCLFSSIRHHKKAFSCFVMTLSIMLLLMGLVNFARFGSFIEFGYFQYAGLSFHEGGWTGLVGLLASPGKGLFVYFPLVILLPLALKYLYRSQNNWLFYLVVYIVVANWLFFGTIDDGESRFWSGATAWGPRYLVSILPFIVLPFGVLIKQVHLKRYGLVFKIAIIILCSAGFVINLPGVLVSSEYGEIYAREEGVYLDDMAWNPYYSPVVIHMRALMDDYASHFPVEEYRYRVLTEIAYGLAPCSFDLYLFCTFGIAPILLAFATLIVLALAILKEDGLSTLFRTMKLPTISPKR